MTTPTKPYHYTQARQTKDGKSWVIDMRFLEALLEHNRVFKVQPVTPRGRK